MTARDVTLPAPVALLACLGGPKGVHTDPAVKTQRSHEAWEAQTDDHASKMIEEGRKTFRTDTFGSEEFWGGQLRLHEAIAGEKNGASGPA
jgi:hypothetical protein